MKNIYKILQYSVSIALLLVSSVRAATLAEQAQQVLDQTETRQRGTLESLLRDPYPPMKSKGGPSLWHYENFALAAYGLNERTEEADAGLLTLQRDLFPEANVHFEAGAIHWHAYFKHYASERATKGLLVEIASPTYAKYSLNTFYNLYDFADDSVLKERMGMLLDLYWADWAIEQINGVRGGSRHRSYTGRASNQQTGGAESAWYHFGVGVEASKHPGVICAATTSWRPSPVVMALALDVENREPYSIRSRRPGRSAGQEPMNYMQDTSNPLYNERGINRLAPEGGSLLRTSWVTPDFILGMSQVEPLPRETWWAASAQNRWNGVTFAGHPTAHTFRVSSVAV